MKLTVSQLSPEVSTALAGRSEGRPPRPLRGVGPKAASNGFDHLRDLSSALRAPETDFAIALTALADLAKFLREHAALPILAVIGLVAACGDSQRSSTGDGSDVAGGGDSGADPGDGGDASSSHDPGDDPGTPDGAQDGSGQGTDAGGSDVPADSTSNPEDAAQDAPPDGGDAIPNEDAGDVATDPGADANDASEGPSCQTVRTTSYDASEFGWCEFDRTLIALPEFVRSGLTFAIAEPWNGGSYSGEPGESCGECWELSNSWTSEVVMVHDLCPIEGNPLCAGGFFHFDLSQEAAAATAQGGHEIAVARPVPCPVVGDILAEISDWNEWGYQRLAFVNHRVPVRQAFVRGLPGGAWIEMERSGGAWQSTGGPTPDEFDGVGFRLTSARGQTVDGSASLDFARVTPGGGHLVVATGAQFDSHGDAGPACTYRPPAEVYGDAWGGIPEVRWAANPWGDTVVSETADGCHAGSRSCLRVDGLGNWAGMHLFHWQPFPASSFTRLILWARTLSDGMTLDVGPSHEGTVCDGETVRITTEWMEIRLPLGAECAPTTLISSVTFQNGGPAVPLLLDDIRFE